MPAPKAFPRELLQTLYYEEGLSTRQVAERLGCQTETVRLRMKRLGIARRSSAEGTRLAEHKGLINHWKPRGPDNPKWRGGIYTSSNGYVYQSMPDHPRAGADGYVPQHTLVWEQTHGRPLPHGWLVHHLNGIKNDNRAENLVAIPRKSHNTVTLLVIARTRIRHLEAELKRVSAERRLL